MLVIKPSLKVVYLDIQAIILLIVLLILDLEEHNQPYSNIISWEKKMRGYPRKGCSKQGRTKSFLIAEIPVQL